MTSSSVEAGRFTNGATRIGADQRSHSPSTSLGYRPEIDGLRAIAVLPVLFYHGGFAWFAGGFVGVDVFFVISGYLITTIIAREIEEGRFSILEFYERRARRVLPALFLVMLVSSVASAYVMFPDKLEDFGKSSLATLAFGSNFYFWQDSGYFAAENEVKPLLHTWSLAVEEQFYVLFPVAMVLAWMLGLRLRGLLFAIIAVGVVGLLGADWESFRNRPLTFYLLPARAWELLVGASLALFLLRKSLPRGWMAQVGGIVGMLLIGVAVFAFDGSLPWPGRWALFPVLGTALIILCASPGTIAHRLLSLRPFVAVGLVSYSAYLWHQPLFALARLGSVSEPSTTALLWLIALALALAWLTWRFVERPFRNRKWLSRNRVFSLATGASIVLALVAWAMVSTEGMPHRFDAATLDLISTAAEDGRGRDGCVDSPELPDGVCRFNPELAPRVLLWGDSHAMALAESLAKELATRGFGLDAATVSGCIPVPTVTRVGWPLCESMVPAQWEYVTSPSAPEVVIVHGRWTVVFEDTSYDNGEGGAEHSDPSRLRLNGSEGDGRPQDQWLADEVHDTIRRIADTGRDVIVVGSVPEAGWDVPRVMALRRRFGLDAASAPSVSSQLFRERDMRTRDALEPLGAIENVSVVWPSSLFCDVEQEGRCVLARNGRALYRDDDHLSRFGASILAPVLADAVSNATAAPESGRVDVSLTSRLAEQVQ